MQLQLPGVLAVHIPEAGDTGTKIHVHVHSCLPRSAVRECILHGGICHQPQARVPLPETADCLIFLSHNWDVAAHLLCSPWLARLHWHSNNHAYICHLIDSLDLIACSVVVLVHWYNNQ